MNDISNVPNREIFMQLMLIERERQNKKFPDQTQQKLVTPYHWVSILTEEIGEFAKEINDHDNLKACIELAECAAVCLRIAEVYMKNDDLIQAFLRMVERTAAQQPATKNS